MSPRLNPAALAHLKTGRNLLAFSAGVDSTALFFLLQENNISFDMATADYGLRQQVREEIAYARELADRYGKQLHLKSVTLEERNFEAEARRARYAFFSELCRTHGYDTLITAHQLNDRTEWLLMQLTKGAGTVELLGMDYLGRETDYTLVRPMLDISRDEIEHYLNANGIHYFEDASNRDPSFTRNAFRHAIGNRLVHEYAAGLQKSFALLRRDAETLLPPAPYQRLGEAVLIRRSDVLADLREIDRHIKRMGYLLSFAQREEIARQKECVVGGRIAVTMDASIICLAPYSQGVMPKETKERFRIAGIPPKIRPYLYEQGLDEVMFCEAKKAILS